MFKRLVLSAALFAFGALLPNHAVAAPAAFITAVRSRHRELQHTSNPKLLRSGFRFLIARPCNRGCQTGCGANREQLAFALSYVRFLRRLDNGSRCSEKAL
jgi:hypothetical protein